MNHKDGDRAALKMRPEQVEDALRSFRNVATPEAELEEVRKTVLRLAQQGSGRRSALRRLLSTASLALLGIAAVLFVSLMGDSIRTPNENPREIASVLDSNVRNVVDSARDSIVESSGSHKGPGTGPVQSVFRLDSGSDDIVLLWILDGVEVVEND